MTDKDEFDRLRDRIETLEDELGIETDVDDEPDVEELFPSDHHLWADLNGGQYYAAVEDIDSIEDDGWNDDDSYFYLDEAVSSTQGGFERVEDVRVRVHHHNRGVEFRERPDILAEVEDDV